MKDYSDTVTWSGITEALNIVNEIDVVAPGNRLS